ncbi:MAG: TauD/TfdA family dioxygenase [Candidatus Binataceae bacterium]
MFLRKLSDGEISAFEARLSATRDLKAREAERGHFDHPTIRQLATQICHELRDGHGAIVLSGLSNERFSPEDFERIYWGLGRVLGKPVIQNYKGDLLTYVEEEPDKNNPYDSRTKGRGYRNSAAAGYHTDTNEIVGLMCVQRAERGGESIISSALAIHNDFVRHHPELLDWLYEGYYQAIGEDEVMTQEKAPVFGFVDGRLCVYFQARAMRLAAQKRGEELSPRLNQAIDYFYERAEGNRAEFLLEPGEILFWNNRNHVHGRRQFENSATRRRLLLRLWIEPDNPLRIPANSAEHTKQRHREAEAAKASA